MSDGLTISFAPAGNACAILTAFCGSRALYTERVDLGDSSAREAFIVNLCRGRSGIVPEAVREELEQITVRVVAQDQRKSQATLLAELGREAELFHTPGADAEGYATFKVDLHRETCALRSRRFRQWLVRRFWREYGKAAGASAVQAAIEVLTGKALFESPEQSVHVRVAAIGDAVYLDLADQDWSVVEVTAAGWQVLNDSAVKFIRARGMMPIRRPVSGGNIDRLRELLNVDDEGWTLLAAWVLAALYPQGPFPILLVNGEQGTAKSTLCRMLRTLLDPNIAPVRCEPRDARDLIIAASNARIIALDNLSSTPPWLSDALCRLSTGGGFGSRELYTDGEEKLFDAQQPVIINGIGDVASRPDLLDRALCITLRPIPDERRRTESAILADFLDRSPQILGAFLDVLVSALHRLPTVRLSSLPRMADFATLAVAGEKALGLTAGSFLKVYSGNHTAIQAAAIEASVLTEPLLRLLDRDPRFEGPAKDLLEKLNQPPITDDDTRRRREWPQNPRKLSSDLQRLAPALRAAGVNVGFPPRTAQARRIVIEDRRNRPSLPSQPSASVESCHGTAPSTGPTAMNDGAQPNETGLLKPADGLFGPNDGSDGSDGQKHVISNRPPPRPFFDV